MTKYVRIENADCNFERKIKVQREIQISGEWQSDGGAIYLPTPTTQVEVVVWDGTRLVITEERVSQWQ